MDSEDDAKDTLLDLRLKKRLFRGQSVKGRLKSETVVRSFYPVQAAPSMPPAIYPGMQMQYAGGFVPGPIPIDMRYGYGMGGPMGGMMSNIGGMMPPPVSMGELMNHVPTAVLASSSQDEQEMKSGSPSQSTRGDRRTPYAPTTTGPQVPQGSGGSSSTAGSYKGAASVGSGSVGRDGVTRERNSKVSQASTFRILYFEIC